MNRFAILSLLVLAACGAKAAPAPKAFAPSPVYAALFQEGTVWTFTVVSGGSDGEATCRVVKTQAFEGGVASQIRCDYGLTLDPATGTDPLQGVWVADAHGLYSLGADVELPASGAPDYAGHPLALDAVPAAKDEEGELEEGSWRREVTQKGDAWCWTYTTAMGATGWNSLCVGPGGVTEGNFGVEDDGTHETTFTLKGTP